MVATAQVADGSEAGGEGTASVISHTEDAERRRIAILHRGVGKTRVR